MENPDAGSTKTTVCLQMGAVACLISGRIKKNNNLTEFMMSINTKVSVNWDTHEIISAGTILILSLTIPKYPIATM